MQHRRGRGGACAAAGTQRENGGLPYGGQASAPLHAKLAQDGCKVLRRSCGAMGGWEGTRDAAQARAGRGMRRRRNAV